MRSTRGSCSASTVICRPHCCAASSRHLGSPVKTSTRWLSPGMARLPKSKVFETYWTTIRGVEAMDNSYRLLDLTAYGRQETWEDSPTGWPQADNMETLRSNGRPRAQWSRLKAGHSDDLGTGRR